MKRKRNAAGFTLIELLVVISIIVIVVTSTIFMIGNFFRGSAVKEAGRIVAAAFSRGRQQASTTRLVHYLVFDFGNCMMRLHADDVTTRDKVFTSADPVSGEPMTLPSNVYFDRISGQTQGAPFVAFQPDGSVTFYASSGGAYPDVSWADSSVGYREGSDTPPSRSDVVLRLGSNSANAPDKVYIDVVPVTGLIRKIEYYHRVGASALP